MSHLLHLIIAASSNPYAIPADGIAPAGNATIGQGIAKVVTLLMEIIGMLSVIFIIIGGIQITLAAGNPAHFKQGRETVLYAAIGIVVAISGYAVVRFVAGSVG